MKYVGTYFTNEQQTRPICNVIHYTSTLFGDMCTMCTYAKLPSMLQRVQYIYTYSKKVLPTASSAVHLGVHTQTTPHPLFMQHSWIHDPEKRYRYTYSMDACRHPSLFKLNLMRTSDTQLSLRSITPLHSLSYQPICACVPETKTLHALHKHNILQIYPSFKWSWNPSGMQVIRIQPALDVVVKHRKHHKQCSWQRRTTKSNHCKGHLFDLNS